MSILAIFPGNTTKSTSFALLAVEPIDTPKGMSSIVSAAKNTNRAASLIPSQRWWPFVANPINSCISPLHSGHLHPLPAAWNFIRAKTITSFPLHHERIFTDESEAAAPPTIWKWSSVWQKMELCRLTSTKLFRRWRRCPWRQPLPPLRNRLPTTRDLILATQIPEETMENTWPTAFQKCSRMTWIPSTSRLIQAVQCKCLICLMKSTLCLKIPEQTSKPICWCYLCPHYYTWSYSSLKSNQIHSAEETNFLFHPQYSKAFNRLDYLSFKDWCFYSLIQIIHD